MLKRVKNNIITAEKKYDVLKKWTLAVAETDGEEFEFSEMKDVTAAGITTVPAEFAVCVKEGARNRVRPNNRTAPLGAERLVQG